MTASETKKTACEAYQDALSRFNELKLEEESLNQQIQAIQDQMRVARKADHLDEAALRLLSGEEYSANGVQQLTSKLEDLKGHKKLIQRALELSYEQVQTRLNEASKEACEEVKSEHQAAVKDIAKALVILAKANHQERCIRQKIEDKGLWTHFIRPMGLPYVGHLNDSENKVNRYLREAIEYGFLSDSEAKKLKGE